MSLTDKVMYNLCVAKIDQQEATLIDMFVKDDYQTEIDEARELLLSRRLNVAAMLLCHATAKINLKTAVKIDETGSS